MAALTTTTTLTDSQPPKRTTRVCFSFAAYSKDLIHHLRRHNPNLPISQGLTLTELTAIESAFRFSFPPDLRSLLREGLPVGQAFPDWRSSSQHQLHILINLPIFGILKEVSRRRFWHRPRWGDRPEDDDQAVELAKGYLKHYPVLVPVYRNYYIPVTPCLAGNPVFYVDGLEVKVWCNDVVEFLRRGEFGGGGGVLTRMRPPPENVLGSPAWAATEARRIDFWTELAEGRRETVVGGGELGRVLEGVRLRLRDGGWKEEDVDEMMEMDGGDERLGWSSWSWTWRLMCERLLRGGWSREDVVESLGCLTEKDPTDEIEDGSDDSGDSFFELTFVDDDDDEIEMGENICE